MSKLLTGRYELLEKIGEGGMAVVYKAKDRLLNRYVAIKILRPEFTEDSSFIESFKRESQAAAGLQHPNIVSVYDVGKEGNIHFIVMELINGRPLSDIIKTEAPFEYKRAIEITKQVASALSLAHKNHIIHRDIKPHNIMITEDGIAKLGDFGIAKAVSDSTVVNENSKIIGSVHYFSPEQARGSYVDERSDIYSLGIVLYEMLTGRVPFDGENAVQVALMHINNDIVPPSKLVNGIPPALEKVVLKATDKFQSNRFKSADEMLQELNNIEFVTNMVGDKVFAGATGSSTYVEENTPKPQERPVATSTAKGAADETEEKQKKKKLWLIPLILLLVAAIVCGGLYAFGIIGGSSEIKVPDLKGMSYAQAQDALEAKGLKIEKGDEMASPDVEEGLIAGQDPAAGEIVKKDTTVTVNISSGKESGVIPNFIGDSFDEATVKSKLEEYGFVYGGVSYEESESYGQGIIIRQSPTPGTDAEEGTSVSIVVSSGKKEEKMTVPSLTGLTVDEAKDAITKAGFTVGTISYEESTVYGKNYVMWQEYGANTELKKGTAISIKVSKGAPEVTPTPDPNDENNGDNGGTGDTDNNSTDEKTPPTEETPTGE